MKAGSQSAFQPTQSKLEQTQSPFIRWIYLAAKIIALFQDKLAQFMTPERSECWVSGGEAGIGDPVRLRNDYPRVTLTRSPIVSLRFTQGSRLYLTDIQCRRWE